MSSEYLVPYWLGDPDYYPRNHPRYAEHRRRIEINKRIDARIDCSVADRSYSVTINRSDR